MYNVNFKTDEGLYDRFRIISTVKKEKLQDILTELIRDYVDKNEDYAISLQAQKSLQPALPKFFDEQIKWRRYIDRASVNTIKNILIRMGFLRYLVLSNMPPYSSKHPDIYKEVRGSSFFNDSDDASYLRKHIGIIELTREFDDPIPRYIKIRQT